MRVVHQGFSYYLMICLVAMGLSLGGCATLPKNFDKPTSVSLPQPHLNKLGQYLQAEAMANPGKSAFHILGNNLDALVARGMLAQVAEKTLDLQYYIFKNDESGALVLSWVMEAANRGVRVRILVDDLGAEGGDSSMALISSHPNVEVRVFNPFSQRSGLRTDFIFDLSRVGRRMHNKSFIADSSAAIIGGRNIGNEYFTVLGDYTFVDIDVLTVGPVVQELADSFDAYWNSEWAYPAEVFSESSDSQELSILAERLKGKRDMLEDSPYRTAVESSNLYQHVTSRNLDFTWGKAELFFDVPEKIGASLDDDSGHLGPQVRPLIDGVVNELLLVSPYFVPGESGMELFRSLRRKGVTVKIVTNSLATNDVWVVHSGYAPYRKELLSLGVEIYEMKSSAFHELREEFKKYVEVKELRLHVKAMVIDEQISILGSSNLDPRSRIYNTELGMVIESSDLARQLSDGFDHLASPENCFRLFLADVEDDKGRVRRKVRWETEEDGEVVVYKDEPGAGVWRKFGAWIMRAFPIEDML